jgi:hypothetical protein
MPAEAQSLKYVRTPEVRVVYFANAAEYIVPYTTQCILNGLEAQKARFGYAPDGGVGVFLQDFSDLGNATTILGAPRNRVFFELSPPMLTFETYSPGERLYALANHELMHLVVADQASKSERNARRWFGGKVAPTAEHPESLWYYYLTNPRASSPRWYQEGSAVFMETWYNGGLGRAQGGYDEMVFRAMVRDDAHFYDPLGLVAKGTEVDFQTGANAYLYGTRFLSYLAHEYSPARLIDWLRRSDGTERYYARDFQRVYGKSIEDAWRDWVVWEHEFQMANLAAVREHPITPFKPIARRALGAISRAYLSKDKATLYAAVRYPGRVPFIVGLDLETGATREYVEIKNPMPYKVSSLAYDGDTETLFYTTDNKTFRSLEALDLRTGKTRLLLQGARIGDIAFDPADRSLWGLRHNNGFVMLVRIPFPYAEWQVVHTYPYGEVAHDLDVSHDGKLISLSFAGPDATRSGVQAMQLRVMSVDRLLHGDATPLHQFEMGTAVPEGFTFSPDGRYLYGSSYYTGVSNIYRYDLQTRVLEALSNAETGYFRPLPLDQSTLLIFHYTGEGFMPATIGIRPTEDLSAITFLGEQIATKYPEVQQWGAGPPGRIDYAATVIGEGAYKPTWEMHREAIYPVVEGYKDSIALGAHARFSDPMGFDGLNLTLSYSPDSDLASKEELHASLTWRHYLWSAGLKWNAGDFYDLFGPTKRSREGYSGFVAYERSLIYDPPEMLSLVARLSYFGDLDALPGFQNVESPTDKLGEAQVGLVYKHPRGSLGKVDDETGYLWSLVGHAYETEGDITPALLGSFDVGWPLQLSHSSIWVRTAAGMADGELEDPLANAYFGGFRNNYVDNGEPKRYRDLLSMPGFEIDALNGRSFVKGMVEWNLPPIRFEKLGSPGFYGSWIRPAIFTTALVTNPDSPRARTESYNIGLQIDLQLQVLHRLPMMLSFGYAKGFEGDGTGEDEVMLSLKLL